MRLDTEICRFAGMLAVILSLCASARAAEVDEVTSVCKTTAVIELPIGVLPARMVMFPPGRDIPQAVAAFYGIWGKSNWTIAQKEANITVVGMKKGDEPGVYKALIVSSGKYLDRWTDFRCHKATITQTSDGYLLDVPFAEGGGMKFIMMPDGTLKGDLVWMPKANGGLGIAPNRNHDWIVLRKAATPPAGVFTPDQRLVEAPSPSYSAH
jgi:hypothetical protein